MFLKIQVGETYHRMYQQIIGFETVKKANSNYGVLVKSVSSYSATAELYVATSVGYKSYDSSTDAGIAISKAIRSDQQILDPSEI